MGYDNLPQEIDRAIDLFLDSRNTESTRNNYRSDLKRHFIPFCIEKNLRTLADLDTHRDVVGTYTRYLEGFRLAPNSRQRSRAAVKSFAAWAVETNQVQGNFGVVLKLPKRGRLTQKPPRLSVDWSQLTKLLDAVRQKNTRDSLRDQLLIGMFWEYGRRNSEIRTMKVYQVQGEPPRVFLRDEKNNDKWVPLPMASWLYDLYRDWVAAARIEGDQYLFPSRQSAVMSSSQVSALIQAYAKAAGIGKLTPRDLRQDHNNAADRVARPAVVSELTGHSPETQARYYSQTSPDEVAEAHRRARQARGAPPGNLIPFHQSSDEDALIRRLSESLAKTVARELWEMQSHHARVPREVRQHRQAL